MRLTTPLTLLLFCTVFASIVTAQNPLASFRVAFASLDEKTLYIQGGKAASGQFFSLDLTVPTWPSSSPPWKQLSNRNAPQDSAHSLTITSDKKSIISWGRSSGILQYDIASDTWTAISSAHSDPVTPQQGLRAVTDPRTGIIYIPGSGTGGQMVSYNPSTRVTSLLPMPQEFGSWTLVFYTAVWSTTRNSILVYGGYLMNVNIRNTRFYEYSPDTNTWSVLITSGVDPSIKESHCMVSASGGNKMIMFGGETITNVAYRSIFFLDVPTLTWTQGTDSPPGYGQRDVVCSVAGDSFIAWSGNEKNAITPSMESPIIYNLKSNQWVTQFSLSGTPPTATLPPVPGAPTDPVNPIVPTSKTTYATSGPQPTNSPDNPPSDTTQGDKSNKTIAIIGASVGGVAVLMIIGFILYRWTRVSILKEKRSGDSTIDGGSLELSSIPRSIGKGSPTNNSYYSDRESNYTQSAGIQDACIHNSPRSPQLVPQGFPEPTASLASLSDRFSKGSNPPFGEKQEVAADDYNLLQLDQRMAIVKAQFDENQALLSHLDELRSKQSELVDGLRKQMVQQGSTD